MVILGEKMTYFDMLFSSLLSFSSMILWKLANNARLPPFLAKILPVLANKILKMFAINLVLKISSFKV